MAAKTTSKGKQDLFEENQVLKAKLKELLGVAKQAEEIVGLNHTAMGIAKIDGQFKLVELKYNPVNKEAQVIDVRDVGKNTTDFALALYGAKEFLVTKIMEETKTRG
jgi:hypothetical protein